jgi:hypothetical protein
MCKNTVTCSSIHHLTAALKNESGYHGNRLVCYECQRDTREMARIERQERLLAMRRSHMFGRVGWGEM